MRKLKNILVTGGAGFIGSNFIRCLFGMSASGKSQFNFDDFSGRVVNLDALTYAGNLENLLDVEEKYGKAAGTGQRYFFERADISDRAAVERIFKEYDIDTVVHFAAESHVDRSVLDPEAFVRTNVLGTYTLLDVAKNYWGCSLDNARDDALFHHISTDEVYGSLGPTGYFTETTLYDPRSPYSASKASADMVVRAYHETFGMPVNITRCSNNYGPYQFPEKLIPLMINNCKSGKQLPVYGDGMQVRDWLHVADHCAAIDTVLHKGVVGEVYNIGGNNEKANIEIVKLIIRALGKSEDLIEYVKDRPGHDRRYAIDNTKITTQLGWAPKYTFEQGIAETIEWYLNSGEWMEKITSGEYVNYYDKMYTQAEK